MRDDIEAGRLEVVLPQMRLPASSIHAVYPHRRMVAAKVRLCVNFLAALPGMTNTPDQQSDEAVSGD